MRVSVGFHPPIEEYLEAIHAMEEEGAEVIQARLAKRLGHAAPSVSEVVRRLRDEGYVEASGRALVLTEPGRERAEAVVRKHRLAERLLADVIGLDWHKVHIEAGRWEHVISDEVAARLDELLGHPLTCPHGNPIPGASRPGGSAAQVPLSAIAPGEHVLLERVTEQIEADQEALDYLGTRGFVPGTAATVVVMAPDGTRVLEVGAETLALGAGMCDQLFVSRTA